MSAYTRRERSTGSVLTVARADDLELDADGGDWVTVCETHGYLVNSPTRRAALRTSGMDFCADCYEASLLPAPNGHLQPN